MKFGFMARPNRREPLQIYGFIPFGIIGQHFSFGPREASAPPRQGIHSVTPSAGCSARQRRSPSMSCTPPSITAR